MTAPVHEMPQPTALEAILRKTTEFLANELACPAQRAPDWSDFEWSIARAVAAMHGVSPLLCRVLRWRGPAAWTGFLDEQRAHTVRRHARVVELLQRLDRQTRGAGIAVVALKGAALHDLGLYTIGDRPMADIDLLVRPADVQGTSRLIESLGYHLSGVSWKERVFTPVDDHAHGELGENAHNNVKIELHERIRERLPWRITDASDLIFPQHARPGLNAYPSKASLMIHLLFHASGSMSTRALRLLHLNDLALLSSHMTEGDWNELISTPGRRLWWAFPPLRLTSKYYPSTIPEHALTALADRCPNMLKSALRRKTLHDVSCSYPWVEAFPGIAWSQSLREGMEYMAGRMWPGAAHLKLREYVAEKEVSLDRSQWASLSQGRRAVRWLTSRQTRPLTMHSVHAALARPQ
jgi:hypothetical protein